MRTQIRHYPSREAIPEHIMDELKTMGYAQHGALREVASGKYHQRLEECLVIFDGSKPVGWGALYSYYCSGARRRITSVGFWVRARYRGLGLGAKLMLKAHARWNHLKPKTYSSANKVWEGLNTYHRLQRKLKAA